jgi:hypothetical protein
VPKQAQLVFQFFRSEFTRMGRFSACLLISRGRFRPAETLRLLGGQPVAVLVEIHQRKARAQPLMVLTYAPVAHPGKSEDALQNAERMLHLGSNSQLSRVFCAGHLHPHSSCIWFGGKLCPAPADTGRFL